MDDMIDVTMALEVAQRQRLRWLERLKELLRFPTISAEYEQRISAFSACGDWLVSALTEIGFQNAQRLPTGGPDVIYADYCPRPEAPTLLIYGHYDVMPVDPLESWRHPPFDPVVVGERLFARGASDDKGQFFALLCAAEAWLRTGQLPLNLKVLLEGEEEETSRHLVDFIPREAARLRCDGILIADMGGLDPRMPLVEYGNRGNCSMEITVRGPARDLHSGTYGGAVDNPLNVLVRLLAHIQDGDTRRVLVPGFYDRVRELTERELKLLEPLPIEDPIGQLLTGAPQLAGEAGYPLKQRISARPTFEVHGIRGGYTGEGVKTVIPASCTAKISFRLVPDQSPDEVFELTRTYLQQLAPPTVHLECRMIGRAFPATVNLDAPVIQAAIPAFQRGFGAPPLFVRGGGSLPILSILQEYIHPDVLLTGFGLPEDNEHAPDESLALGQFYRGIDTAVIYYAELARRLGRSQNPERDGK